MAWVQWTASSLTSVLLSKNCNFWNNKGRGVKTAYGGLEGFCLS